MAPPLPRKFGCFNDCRFDTFSSQGWSGICTRRTTTNDQDSGSSWLSKNTRIRDQTLRLQITHQLSVRHSDCGDMGLRRIRCRCWATFMLISPHFIENRAAPLEGPNNSHQDRHIIGIIDSKSKKAQIDNSVSLRQIESHRFLRCWIAVIHGTLRNIEQRFTGIVLPAQRNLFHDVNSRAIYHRSGTISRFCVNSVFWSIAWSSRYRSVSLHFSLV